MWRPSGGVQVVPTTPASPRSLCGVLVGVLIAGLIATQICSTSRPWRLSNSIHVPIAVDEPLQRQGVLIGGPRR